MFNPQNSLKANTQHVFIAQITGPPSWYGQGGQAHIEHSGVKFSFMFISDQTNVKSVPFSEFVFTLA